jgi:hypothetical protein
VSQSQVTRFQLRSAHSVYMEQTQIPKQPRLPAEIWHKIFAMATRLPGDLIDPAPPYRIEASPHQWPQDLYKKDEKAKLKLSLVLVCRSWQQMATEILYEIVCVNQRFDHRRSTRARALRWTFETTAGVRSTKGGRQLKRPKRGAQVNEGAGGISSYVERGYGRWVKQLSFDMDFVPVEDLACIVRHCPNLRTLIIDKRNAWKPDKVESLFLHAIPADLQRVELLRTWGTDSPVIPQEFATLLHQRSSIKSASLSCENIHFGVDLPPSQLAALTLIYPRTAHLSSLEQWKLPSLTHLSLTKTVVTAELISVVQHFGPQLLFLDVNPEAMSIFTRNLFLRFCSTISSSCPRLRGFVLYDSDILPHHLRSHSLTHLVRPTHSGWCSTHAAMGKILVSDFPALTCIRVLAGRDPLHPLFPLDNSTHWVVECQARGIRVEDEDGVDLLHSHYQPKFFAKTRRNATVYNPECV